MLDTNHSPGDRRDPRGFNNRKRRFREEEERAPHERQVQRRRYEESPLIVLRKVIQGLAEPSSRRPEDDIDTIAKLLAELGQQDESQKAIIKLLQQFIIEQPLKLPFLAGAIVVLNITKSDLAGKIISDVTAAAQNSLGAGSWRDFKLQLRLLACLQLLLTDDGLFPFLNELFETAVLLQSSSEDDKLGLELTKIILFTIPYIMASIGDASSLQASALLEKTDIIASTPHPLEAIVNPLISSEGSEQPSSVISLLQKQLQAESSNGWPLKCLLRPWLNARTRESLASPESVTKHTLSSIQIPSQLHTGSNFVFSELYFSVYAKQEVKTVPSTLSITSTLVRDALTDTINCLDFNRNLVAKMLVDTDCYFDANIFVKRAVPYDQLREVAEESRRYKPEDVAVDAVFSLLLQLPSPEHLAVFYHGVLTETCKTAPAAVAPSLGRAIMEIYKRLDELDIELYHRFLDWFSHHLSNFGFTWKWAEWQDDVALPDLRPKKAFIRGVLEKEIRLSFPKRIRGNVPEAYHELITKSNELEVPEFKFNHDDVPFSSEAREIAQMIRKKAPDQEMQGVLATIVNKAAEQGVEDPSIVAVDAFMTAICHIGSKSLSHVLSYIDRCRVRLLVMVQDSDVAKRQIINSVLEYWKDQPGVGISILDKLLNYSILSPMSVIDWTLVHDESKGRKLSQNHVYELFYNTVIKVTSRIRQLAERPRDTNSAEEQAQQLEKDHQEEVAKMRLELRQLSEVIEAQLVSISNSHADEMSQDAATGDEETMIKWWADQWLRAYRRLFAVEDAVVNDILEARQYPIHVPQAATSGEADISEMLTKEEW